MIKPEVIKCDIEDCDNEWEKPKDYQKSNLQVIYLTEQTEGRSVSPYLEALKLDICAECFKEILKTGKYLKASGAQGSHTVRFAE